MGLNEFIQIGNNIRAFRKAKGLTQRQVAEDLQIPYSTYSNYENNNREPSFDVLKMIAKYFGVSVAQLISDEAVAEEEHTLFQEMLEYLDEIDCDVQYDSGLCRYEVISATHGTVAILSEGDLDFLFRRIKEDSEMVKERYIIGRLAIEFDINKKS